MHFKSDALTYEGSSTDWLGFDNGERDIPSNAISRTLPRPNPVVGNRTPESDQEIADFLGQFSPTMGVEPQTSFMNYSLGVTLANQFQLKNGNTIGYLFTGNYKNNTKTQFGYLLSFFLWRFHSLALRKDQLRLIVNLQLKRLMLF